MTHATLPPAREMYDAFRNRDSSYDGVFITAVRTTGIFCRPTCSARKPRDENVEFYPSTKDALLAGYRPCKRCRPMELNGRVPDWLRGLMEELEQEPSRRWRDADLRARSLDPTRVRRWFQSHHGMTFHSYQRARRLGLAMGRIRHGDALTAAAFDHGFESTSGFNDAFGRLFGGSPGRIRTDTLITVTRLLTPLGPMVAGATDEGICLLEFADRRMLETQVKRLGKWLNAVVAPGTHPHLEHLDRELARYFAGDLREFVVPQVVPGTPFQTTVWDQLCKIPYGETRSYEQLARTIGRPTAQRAVGRANGDNRPAIIVPCHRVVRSDGSLCGYGGGLWRKQYLLDLES